MYSSPNAVGPIALLESFVVEYVDDYVKDNFDDENDGIDTEDDKLVDEIYSPIYSHCHITLWRTIQVITAKDTTTVHHLLTIIVS